MKSTRVKGQKVVGWREWVGLPDLGIKALKVKIDSGARTCALHATHIRYLEKHNGETWVSFLIDAGEGTRKERKRVRAPLVEQRIVRSSIGHATLRPVIRTILRLGDDSWPVEVTLVNRDPMGFRMLIGRSALRGRFLIHPAKSFIQTAPKQSHQAE